MEEKELWQFVLDHEELKLLSNKKDAEIIALKEEIDISNKKIINLCSEMLRLRTLIKGLIEFADTLRPRGE